MKSEKRLIRHLFLAGAALPVICGALLISGCDRQPQGEKPATEKQGAENPTKRVSFQDLFEVNGSTVTPKKVIRVGVVTMTPEVPFESQVMKIEDQPFSNFIGRDAEVRQSGMVLEIVKFY